MVQDLVKKLLLALALAVPAAAVADTRLVPTLKLAAEERYDDDLLLRAVAGGTGQLISKLSLEAGVELKDPTLTGAAWYAPDFLMRHGSGSTGLDHRGALELRQQLSRRLEIDTHFQIWRVSDPTSLPRLGLARTLSPILYGRAELAAHYRFTPRWTGIVAYRFEGAQIYDGSGAAGVVHSPFAELLYAATRRDEVGVQVRYQRFGPDWSEARALFASWRYRLAPGMSLTARAGPVWYRGGDGGTALLPAINLELEREGRALDLGLVVGHDLAGASGFTSVLWCDYASGVATYRMGRYLRAFGAASYFRNGHRLDEGVIPFAGAGAASGYAIGGGLEWRFSRYVSAQAAADRLVQIAAPAAVAGPVLSRNIIAARLRVTVF